MVRQDGRVGELLVRLAEARDADGIARVHVGTWQVAYRGQIPDDYLDAMSLSRFQDVWRGLLGTTERDETNWVAEYNDEIVGFAGAGASRDDDADGRTGELFAVYVRADQWDTGAGAALMKEAVTLLRERFDAATLWVLDTNERARGFYEKGGWRPDGAKKDDDRGSFVLHEVRYRIDF